MKKEIVNFTVKESNDGVIVTIGETTNVLTIGEASIMCDKMRVTLSNAGSDFKEIEVTERMIGRGIKPFRHIVGFNNFRDEYYRLRRIV